MTIDRPVRNGFHGVAPRHNMMPFHEGGAFVRIELGPHNRMDAIGRDQAHRRDRSTIRITVGPDPLKSRGYTAHQHR